MSSCSQPHLVAEVEKLYCFGEQICFVKLIDGQCCMLFSFWRQWFIQLFHKSKPCCVLVCCSIATDQLKDYVCFYLHPETLCKSILYYEVCTSFWIPRIIPLNTTLLFCYCYDCILIHIFQVDQMMQCHSISNNEVTWFSVVGTILGLRLPTMLWLLEHEELQSQQDLSTFHSHCCNVLPSLLVKY